MRRAVANAIGRSSFKCVRHCQTVARCASGPLAAASRAPHAPLSARRPCATPPQLPPPWGEELSPPAQHQLLASLQSEYGVRSALRLVHGRLGASLMAPQQGSGGDSSTSDALKGAGAEGDSRGEATLVSVPLDLVLSCYIKGRGHSKPPWRVWRYCMESCVSITQHPTWLGWQLVRGAQEGGRPCRVFSDQLAVGSAALVSLPRWCCAIPLIHAGCSPAANEAPELQQLLALQGGPANCWQV